ncbi:hypothetical protein ANN_13072 [Periplaneta americana]|uniref:Bcl-2 Bcl-2 homology region 1-3 domain-containing protein n=1 Tax=Periplaneta americana TaxID=6978 RepID=A0ABQ8TJQ8_PERAM|nr:hypothetical protein ANN_13072 [Periplaneta americana]
MSGFSTAEAVDMGDSAVNTGGVCRQFRRQSNCKSFAKRLAIEPNNIGQAFLVISDELFQDGITWSRIIALYALAGRLALFYKERKMNSNAEEVPYHLKSCIRRISPFVRKHGGWCAVSSTQKFLVQQHITTSKHQANKQLNSKQRQLFLTQPTTSNVRSEFNIDLCRSLISADIPLYKLKNKVFREFLEKYTQHTIPDESTLRKTYAPSIYDETIQKIRDEIKDSSIWVSIDETPDKEGRLVGNVVIGLLSEQYSERILLHCDVLEKCNNKTIVKLFNEAMGILWPKGIMYDNVLFFISDAAPYMVKAGQALSVVYPKLTHFTCVAHAFHRVAEVVRDNFLK